MEYYNQIFAIGIFALYSFIFSLFILPGIRNLKNIQSKLRSLIKPTSFFQEDEASEKNERGQQRKDLTNMLGEYKLEYKEIFSLKNYLIAGGILTLGALAYLALIIIFFDKKAMHPSLIVIAIYIVFIGLFMIFAFKEHIPSPSKITEWSYMIEHFAFSPSGIAKCANLKVDYNPRDTQDIKKPRPIRIYSDIELRGYIYWFFAYDTDSGRSVYSIVGQINKNSEMYEAFPDIRDFSSWFTTIGEFDAYKFRGKKLKMNFFVFDPALPKNKCKPYWGSRDFEFDEKIGYSSEWSVNITSAPYQKIIYEGNNLKFNKIYWDDSSRTLKKDKERDENIKKFFLASKKAILKGKTLVS